jgi:hypothetical protein
VAGAEESIFHVAGVSPSLLKEGSNLLAVEVHQVNPTSSDVSFDLELMGWRPVEAVVTVEAEDAEGREIPLVPPWLDIPQLVDPVVFRIHRTGTTQYPLMVMYELAGTALRGLDYTLEPNLPGDRHPLSLTIPEGASSARLAIWPVDDGLVEEPESVGITLLPQLPNIDPVVVYRVGDPSSARGIILSNDLTPNAPPSVKLISPEEALAEDSDGWVQFVEFLAGERRIGWAENRGPGQSFIAHWLNVPSGEYLLRARATDNTGGTALSDAVRLLVRPLILPPVVNVFAVDAEGAEISPLVDIPPNPALFEVRREGGTDTALTVFYEVGGTAANGVDYVKLSGEVVIPAGHRSAEIRVDVLDDLLAEGPETVIVALKVPGCPTIYPPPPECYRTGLHGRDFAVIRDNDGPPPNIPPRIRLIHPLSGSHFSAPAVIELVAAVVDPDGWVGRVEFFANGRKIGEQQIIFIQEPPPGLPQEFNLTWPGVPEGEYVLTAKAHDSRDGSTESDPVRVTVGERPTLAPLVSVMAVDPWAREGADAAGVVNTASFLVRRTGLTNDPLTVLFSLRGTAENGTDYEKLEGFVTIPAGRLGARVGVLPVDDGVPELLETVILKLEPDPSLGPVPRYIVGFPGRAAAVIGDNDHPRPGSRALDGGSFHVYMPAEGGPAFRVEGSPDLMNWQVLGMTVASEGMAEFVDPESPSHSTRFYRMIAEPDVAVDE